MCGTRILLIAAILLTAGAVTKAEEAKKLGVTVDVTYASKWMSKGRENYSEDGAFFESISLDFWGTGFGASVTHINPANTSSMYGVSDKKDNQRLDYSVSYKNSLFGDRRYKTKYKAAWIYKNYYDRARNENNVQAWKFTFSWPKILPIDNLAPYYIAHYEYPAGSHYDKADHWAGWVHRFGLGYDVKVSPLPGPLHLSSEVAYTDGLRAAEHDWSYATFGISTKVKIIDNVSFVPGVYHQISMDDSVCDHDVTYCKLSMKYKF